MLDQDRYWDCLDQAMQASSGGRLEEALAWLEEALRANPGGAEAHNSRGELLWDHGRFEEALQEFSKAVEADAELYAAYLNRVEILIEEFQELEEAVELADGLLATPLDRGVEAEVYYLKAKAYFYMEDLDGALFLLRRAIQTHSDVPVYRSFEGQILFEIGHFEEARRSLEQALALEPEGAHTLYHLALVLEFLGDRERAEELFAQAAEIAPDQYPAPVRIESDEFERVAEEALRSLPPDVRRYVAHCAVLMEELPGRDLVCSENVSPQILGLFDGTPAAEPGASPTWGTSPKRGPDRIFLYKRNLEKVAQSRGDLIRQIQITVRHEIGHYLGLDEDEIDRLGLA
jgi:predicted Zn-dependent protease with MMP-like domain/predicted negative regulator of RcsB-dependent stress response